MSPPVTINYSGNSSALLINATGTGKGAEVHINNTNNTSSALYGITNGSGAGLTGYNQGTVGPAGKFGILNANSAQPAVSASTNGTGTAVVGMITSSSNHQPALLGVNTVGEYGVGVEGLGTNFGMFAEGGSGIYAVADAEYGDGVLGKSFAGDGVHGISEYGNGVFGSSTYGYAGYFAGTVAAVSYTSTSDRNAKTHIKLIDGQNILARIERLPVSSWVFKNDPLKSHVGPMAQDFHSAFHLSGDDDKHINLTDITGVSLAAIKELSKEMKLKDARIAALETQLRCVTDQFTELATRMTVLEQQHAAGPITASVATAPNRTTSALEK